MTRSYQDHSAAIAVTVVALIFSVLVGSTLLVNVYSCSSLGEATGTETKFDLMNGCLVQVGGRWIPQNNWRETSP